MEVLQTEFGEIDGKAVHLFTIKNDSGMEVSCIDYGCIITKVLIPDRDGKLENVVLGFDSVEDYQRYSPYFGAVVGRVAGRIKGGQFQLDGKSYTLPQNENENHLHGGEKGFSQVLWDAEMIRRENEAGVAFSYTSPDGEEGYPGTLKIKVIYLLTNENELKISYDAVTDSKTLLDVTNHTYFNLSGDLKRDVLDHVIQMKSDRFLELNEELLPTGEIIDVEGTPFDLRNGRKIREGVESEHPQNILAGNGYDHAFLLNASNHEEIVLADEESGRQIVVETDQPAVVFYTGNQLGDDFDIRGTRSRKHLGACLETQGPPDSIHHPNFSQAVLDKDENYHSTTTYSFKVK